MAFVILNSSNSRSTHSIELSTL